MSALFPQRSTLTEFLNMYNQLPDDAGEEEVDLADSDYADSDSDGSDNGEDLRGFVADDAAAALDPEEEEAEHKAFDADARDAEQAAMEALAKSFEAKTADYMLDGLPMSQARVELSQAHAKANKARRGEEEAAQAAEAEAESRALAKEAAKRAAKRSAIAALYEDDSSAAHIQTNGEAAAKESAEHEGKMLGKVDRVGEMRPVVETKVGARYRIKKRPKA